LSLTAFGAHADDKIDFNRDVRPILSDKCFACHGPDNGSREADLRLDDRDSAVMDRGGYQVVAPGQPGKSELINRVRSDEDYERMPPDDFGKTLSDGDIKTLVRWIEQGAPWQGHWSWVPPIRPEVPKVANQTWVLNPVDAFILSGLESRSLKPSPVAGRRWLARRLSFDLTGLPPTLEQVNAFIHDGSPHAYERIVDRLLDSPHYGERMAMYWLDLVRYADTLGYHGDQERSVSPYRDYVIAAFNDNMPFDQFTIENLAGDLLPHATLKQKVASTYNRLNRASGEGGVQPKEYLAKYAADRVRTTGSVWLGSTFGCAECHDHKFDPFTTKDFYSFASFFADVKEQGIVAGANHIEQLPVPTSHQSQELDRLNSQMRAAETQLAQRDPERSAQFDQWCKQTLQDHANTWIEIKPDLVLSTGGATMTVSDHGVISVSERSPEKDTYVIEATLHDAITAIRLDVLPDPSLPAQGPGRAANGNFVVQKVTLEIDGKPAEWVSATATHSQDGYPVDHLATGNAKGWAILPKVGTAQQAILRLKHPGSGSQQDPSQAESSRGKLTIVQSYGSQHAMGRFRLAYTTASQPPAAGQALTEELIALLRADPNTRTEDQQNQLWKHFRETSPAMEPLRQRIAALRAEKKKVENSIVTTLATSAGTPREMRVLPRGDWMDDSGPIVTPAVPEFLPQPATVDRRLNRLDLAQWICSPDNPLTARTFVNRIWMLMFGAGIAPSVDDLGSQGQWPTHPELLDWLTVEFTESGWDVKHLVKLLVMSNTYRQSSQPRPDLQERDPYNQLYARQSRWRLEAEMVRDNALAASGLLVNVIGGRSARPYQPPGYWAQLNFPKRTYQHDTNQNQYRRGLYTHWQRTFLHPSLLAFDAPVREECTAKRDRSNTPLQALVLLNDPTFVEAARVLAARAMSECDQGIDEKIAWFYRQVLSRDPSAVERSILREFYQRNATCYEEDPKAAEQLLSIGLAAQPAEEDRVSLAAWTAVARAILNLHESITRY
jgi:hypothetical protein